MKSFESATFKTCTWKYNLCVCVRVYRWEVFFVLMIMVELLTITVYTLFS